MKHLVILSILLALGGPALADQTLLTVTGPDGARSYDLAALEALETVQFATATIWTEGTPEFTGVPLMTLLEDAGIAEGTVMATAINDYAVQIPVDEITAEYPVVAYRVDGQTMSVRDKGPLWVVYPYDANPDLQSEIAYSRSIWQLDRIAVAK